MAKNDRINELRKISDIYKDREGREVNTVGGYRDAGIQQIRKKNGTCLLSRDATMYTNIINKYRAMQKKNMAREVRYQDLTINEEEKGVMRIIFDRLGIKENRDIQKIFNMQAGRYGNDIQDDEVEMLNIKSGEVIRLLKGEIYDSIIWNSKQMCYEFRRMEPILTQSIMRQLTMDEESFFQNKLHMCIILRQIINVENETAKIWLAPRRIIDKTKAVGERVLKATKNRKSIFDEHRIQAKLEKMDNPYMEGIAQDMKVVISDLLSEEVDLDVNSLVRESGASNQIIHTDELNELNRVSVFLPTSGKYKLAVYMHKGMNEYNQEVLETL